LLQHVFGEEDGTYSTLVTCAMHAARGAGRNTSAAAPWLLYVAGDLPPLYQLMRSHPTLAAHVVSAEGALGHVSSGVLCRGTRHGRAKVCSQYEWDPSGAWTRAMVDAWMLGATDVMVRLGGTSFMNVVRGRVAWPLPQIELVGSFQPEGNWTRVGKYMHAMHSLVDLLSSKLAEKEAADGERRMQR
jgi:hypothetical protein